MIANGSMRANPTDDLTSRVNINTAPRFVLEKLPWLESMFGQAARQLGRSVDLARSIVEHRNARAKGFKSIGELMAVNEIYLKYLTAQNVKMADTMISDG